MKIEEMKAKFKNGEFNKQDLLQHITEKHSVLFEFCKEIPNTEISAIKLTEEGVCYTSRTYGIDFLAPFLDMGSAPAGMFNLGNYEQVEGNICLKLIEPGFTIFDVGANVGWFSMIMMKKRSDLEIYAFEPIPATFKILKQNFKINELDPPKFFNFGLYSENTQLTFYYDQLCSGKTSVSNLAEKEVDRITCDLKTMDSFVKEHNITKIDFLKCDVEGAEIFVYKGGLKTIERLKPIIFSEMLRKWSAKFNYHPNDIINMLGKIGYGCYVIRNDNLVTFGTMDDKTVDTNFIFLHSEKHLETIESRVLD